MFVRIIKFAFSPMFGKKNFQRLFEALHRFSLIGMNSGAEAGPENSGEKYAVSYVSNKISTIENPNIFDVGANIGKYAIMLNNTFGSNANIHAFEPSQKTFEKLSKNTENCKNIQLHNFGFGDTNTSMTLYSNSDASGLASVYKRNLEHIKVEMNKTESIDIRTIDSFCEESGIKQIHFLKLDIEGHELKALQGAKNLLQLGAIQFIQFEFGGCNIDSRTFFRDFFYLLNDDYIIYRIVKNGLRQVSQYNEICEVFIKTDYLAEKRSK